MLFQSLFSKLDWWNLQTAEDGRELYLVRQSAYASLEPKGLRAMRKYPHSTTHTLSFEKFLEQWVQKKWNSTNRKPLFSVYIYADRGRYQFSILAWGYDNEGNLCLLAVCCAFYFTDEHHIGPNQNKAYIVKTESVGLQGDMFKNYHFNETVSLTIAMKTAFVEYMGVLGCQVHLWAFPAEVGVENNIIHDLLLPGAGRNRSEKVQRRTQEDLLMVYVNGYEHFGIAHEPFQLDIVLPQMADIPVFLNDDDGGELDVKQAEFDEAVGSDIKKFKEELKNKLDQIKEHSNAINKRLRESTLILKSQYCIFSCNKDENSDIPRIKMPDPDYYHHDKNILLNKLKQMNFHTLDKVVESSKTLSIFLKEELMVKFLDFNVKL